MDNQTGKKPRVVLLYRASSKQQTSKSINDKGEVENDIPLQRNILKPWAEEQGWEFVDELVEGGVSGFKVSAENRSEIQKLKLMAVRGEFDILGIYMSDRLGRIAAETPLIIEFLNRYGIKVISYREGLIGGQQHSDKLLTYIRYWQAEGESLKTSARVTDAIEQLVKNGRWRGGPAPYGYRMVVKGTLNSRGRPIFDIEIDPSQAEVVKKIFKMYATDNYGLKAIAQHLNDKETLTQTGLMWCGSYIHKILTYKFYIGVYELGKHSNKRKNCKRQEVIVSPPMEHLRIVDDGLFNEVQRLLKANANPRGEVRATRRGSLLLTGVLFCGECGNKMTSVNIVNKKKRNGEETEDYENRYYRCRSYQNPKTGRPKCGTKMHRAESIEKWVNDDIRTFITELDKEKLLGSFNDVLELQLKEAQDAYKRYNLAAKQCEKEIGKLKDEVMRVIMGESKFSEDMLTGMLTAKEKDLAEFEGKMALKQDEIESLELEIQKRKGIVEELDTWVQRYESSSLMDKKDMVITIVEKISVHKERILIDCKIRLKAEDITPEPTQNRQPPEFNPENPSSAHHPTLFNVKRSPTHTPQLLTAPLGTRCKRK